MGDCCLEGEEGWCTDYIVRQRIPLVDCFRKETIFIIVFIIPFTGVAIN